MNQTTKKLKVYCFSDDCVRLEYGSECVYGSWVIIAKSKDEAWKKLVAKEGHENVCNCDIREHELDEILYFESQ